MSSRTSRRLRRDGQRSSPAGSMRSTWTGEGKTRSVLRLFSVVSQVEEEFPEPNGRHHARHCRHRRASEARSKDAVAAPTSATGSSDSTGSEGRSARWDGTKTADWAMRARGALRSARRTIEASGPGRTRAGPQDRGRGRIGRRVQTRRRPNGAPRRASRGGDGHTQGVRAQVSMREGRRTVRGWRGSRRERDESARRASSPRQNGRACPGKEGKVQRTRGESQFDLSVGADWEFARDAGMLTGTAERTFPFRPRQTRNRDGRSHERL